MALEREVKKKISGGISNGYFEFQSSLHHLIMKRQSYEQSFVVVEYPGKLCGLLNTDKRSSFFDVTYRLPTHVKTACQLRLADFVKLAYRSHGVSKSKRSPGQIVQEI